MDENFGLTLFNATNVIYATGGPSGIYFNSAYPISQTCSHGAAFEIGAEGSNLTEWQYGISSIKFRWNLSGSYQQVIPRYISTNLRGEDSKEFLDNYFNSTSDMLNAIFLKGYQWPFDPEKSKNKGSSIIDMAVYNEINVKNRRVFLDFTRNPINGSNNGELEFSLLSEESYSYLKNSNSLSKTPVDRLKCMNFPAYKLFKNNGIDLEVDPLEISVCAQHNNGGLAVDIWWQSNIKHLFPVGEVSGTFGVYRPGGTALNSTQVGSTRAAQYIYHNYNNKPLKLDAFMKLSKEKILNFIKLSKSLLKNNRDKIDAVILREYYQKRMDKFASIIRNIEDINILIEECKEQLINFSNITKVCNDNLNYAFINRDILISQYVYLYAMKDYIERGGKSRGSYVVVNNYFENIDNPDEIHENFIQKIELVLENFSVKSYLERVKEIPEDDGWFEKVYGDYLNQKIFE